MVRMSASPAGRVGQVSPKRSSTTSTWAYRNSGSSTSPMCSRKKAAAYTGLMRQLREP